MRNVYVLSAGITRYGKSQLSARELALEASKKAIVGAGISPADVQAGFVANAFSLSEKQGHLGPIVMSGLGILDVPASTIESACASGSSAIREAWVNIGAGLYECMLVVGVEKVSQLDTITATTYFRLDLITFSRAHAVPLSRVSMQLWQEQIWRNSEQLRNS